MIFNYFICFSTLTLLIFLLVLLVTFQFRKSLRSFEKSFTGESMVNYLIEKNIATDKNDAISYGEDLLKGEK